MNPRSGNLLFAACILLFLFAVGSQYDRHSGFSRLIGFGDRFPLPRHPQVEAAGVYVKPNTSGYDAQSYIPIALDPSLRDATLLDTVDSPAYRARRILMPASAYALGWGNPAWIIQAYSLLNVIAWLFLAFYLRSRLNGLQTPEMFCRWFACLFSVGVLDSVRLSLTDLPAACWILLALFAFEREADKGRGVVYAALGSLTKETSILTLAALPFPKKFCWRAWLRYAVCAGLALLPLALWMGYLLQHLPMTTGVKGNFTFPLQAMYEYGTTILEKIHTGNANIHSYFGIVAIASGLLQVVLCVRYFSLKDPWFRVALFFALIFILAGESVWASSMAPLRIVLPLTLILALRLPKNRGFYPALALISLPTIYAIIRWIYNL